MIIIEEASFVVHMSWQEFRQAVPWVEQKYSFNIISWYFFKGGHFHWRLHCMREKSVCFSGEGAEPRIAKRVSKSKSL